MAVMRQVQRLGRAGLRPVDSVVAMPPLKSVRLLDQLRERIRLLHYSRRTEEAYVYWARAYIRFHELRHPAEMGKADVENFLTHLAAQKGLSVSTHRQALSALIFLYDKVLGLQLPWLAEIGRPVPVRRLPVVLSRDEVAAVLGGLKGVHLVLARLLYGTGMRISEGLQLRVKDVDFAHRSLIVREGKGSKDRVVILPDALVAELRDQLRATRQCWAGDVEAGRAGVAMPSDALARELVPVGPGSGYFRKTSIRPIRAAARCAGIISMPRRFSARSKRRWWQPRLPSQRHLTRCGTALQHTCYKLAATYGLCRNCSVTPM